MPSYRLLVVGVRLVLLGGILVAWHSVPESVVPSYAVGRPVEVASALLSLLVSGSLLTALVATSSSVMLGMLVGAPAGIGLALAMSIRPIRWLLHPLVTIAYAIPKVGLISLFIMWLGISQQSHIALVTSFVMFVYFYGTRQALAEIDQDKLAALILMGAKPLTIMRLLLLPASAPHLYAATRIALPLGFGASVFAELRVPASKGLGTLLSNFANSLDGAGALAVMIVVALVAYLLDVGLGARLRQHTESIGAGVEL
jgi:NitT/TauT family transport system permease protein